MGTSGLGCRFLRFLGSTRGGGEHRGAPCSPRGPGSQQRAPYLAVVENLVDGFGHEEDLPAVTADHKQEAVGRLRHQTHPKKKKTPVDLS